MKHLEIKAADDGLRFDRWAKAHLPGVPFGALQKFLRKGSIRLDGKRLKPDTRVATGQIVAIRPEVLPGEAPTGKVKPAVKPGAANELRRLILYEDTRCFVLNKPAGLATQGGTGITDSVDHRLAGMADGNEIPKLVHRLDRETSGILVVAKNRIAAAQLTKAFARKDIEKTYWALVVGVPEKAEGTINAPLLKVGASERMEVDPKGQASITRYRVVERVADRLAWVELTPVTGRTHQLRVHMAHIGHPIYADMKYGSARAFPEGIDIAEQLHLHARRLAFEEKGYSLDVTAPLPKHMAESWKFLGLTR